MLGCIAIKRRSPRAIATGIMWYFAKIQRSCLMRQSPCGSMWPKPPSQLMVRGHASLYCSARTGSTQTDNTLLQVGMTGQPGDRRLCKAHMHTLGLRCRWPFPRSWCWGHKHRWLDHSFLGCRNVADFEGTSDASCPLSVTARG
jgi:hypothetical protein